MKAQTWSPAVRDRGLLDTSVFIASETGRPLDASGLPEEIAISVVTLAELQVGVIAARDAGTRARRLATLDSVAGIEILPIDELVARFWSSMRVQLAEAGRRVNVNDLWIAATAASSGIPVIIQDADFAVLEGMIGLRVRQV